MMSRALFAPESGTPQPSVAPIGRTFSDAPTVITFFAVPGRADVLPPAPAVAGGEHLDDLLVAGDAGRASRTSASYSCESRVVGAADGGAPRVVRDRARQVAYAVEVSAVSVLLTSKRRWCSLKIFVAPSFGARRRFPSP